MKQLIYTIFSVFTFLSCGAQTQLIVKGLIKDQNHNEIFLFEPINGFFNQDFADSNSRIQISQNGNFEKKIKLVKQSMFCLKIGITPIYFFAEPGDTIEIFVDTNKFSNISPNEGIIFKGKNSVGNEYFNSFNWQPGKKFGDFENIADDSLHFHETYDFHATDFALNKVTSFFDTLLNKNLITHNFYDIVVSGIRGILITGEIRYLFVGQNTIPFNEAIAIANEIYKKYPVTSSMIKQTVFGNAIAYYFYKTLAGKNYSSERLADSSLAVSGIRLSVNSNFVYWLYAPKDIQEISWAKSLIDLKEMFADHYGMKDVDAFLTIYPNSPFKKYILNTFKELEAPVNFKDSSLIVRINDTTSRRFSDFIKTHFSGEKLYVDLWASWCVPCKQEFAFAKGVDSFCNKNNIKILYISIDEPNMENAMIRNIYAYNLKGYHVRANKSLFSDIENTFTDENKIFAIPRYLLIDEKGKVVDANAPRPSSGNELFNVMKKEFNLKD